MLRALVFALLCACAVASRMFQGRQYIKEVMPGVGSYYVHNTPMNWTDAAEYCRVQKNSYLAFPSSQEEATLLSQIMKSYKVPIVHSGFHDQFKEGEYYTITGERFSHNCYKYWYGAYGSTDKNCGAMRDIPGLIDTPCSTKYPFICVNYNFFKEDFDYIPGHGYYMFHRARRTWMDAQQTCEAESSNLLVLNSEEELRNLTSRYGQFTGWVGVHHKFVNWQFITIHDEPLATTGFTRWQRGQPSGTNDQNPYLVVNSSPDYGLALRRETDLHSFICEHRPSVLRSPELWMQ